MSQIYIFDPSITDMPTAYSCYKGINGGYEESRSLVEDMNLCSVLLSKRDSCDYREDTQLGRISVSPQ